MGSNPACRRLRSRLAEVVETSTLAARTQRAGVWDIALFH
jgi:hypothetical protein